MKRLLLFSVLITLPFLLLAGVSAASAKDVHLIELVDDTINPVTAEYITNAIQKAESQDASCLVLKLDTPGGLLSSTRRIVKRILSADIPVVVYIAPNGSRAGSAGVFLTYASHVAVMAPLTNIGAAHPVQMDGGSKRKDVWDGLKGVIGAWRREKSSDDSHRPKEIAKKGDDKVTASDSSGSEDVMGTKILQDTVAFIKSIAEKRNRNIEWAISSVTESASITATEALEKNVIDFIAKDEVDLLNKLDGKQLILNGREVTLHTKGAPIKRYIMDFRQNFFNILANPNIAYILFTLGFYGLLYEVTHPGFGVPGVMGIMFLILAFFSMQTLPTNYAGLALIFLGLILFIAEAYAPGFGFLALGGVISMVLGSLLLFDTSLPFMKISISLIISVTLATGLITIVLIKSVLRAHLKKSKCGQEGLIGEMGVLKTEISSTQEGKVAVHGEIWTALSDEPIAAGTQVIVREIKGMILKVQKV